MALNQQVDKKAAKKFKLLNTLFDWCSYKNSCFSELEYNSSVQLMVYSYKDVLKEFALDFVGSFESFLYFV